MKYSIGYITSISGNSSGLEVTGRDLNSGGDMKKHTWYLAIDQPQIIITNKRKYNCCLLPCSPMNDDYSKTLIACELNDGGCAVLKVKDINTIEFNDFEHRI